MIGNAFERFLSRYKRPQRVVNLCFIVVFLCSTLLTWREVAVLESAYISNQRNSLDNIATALDRQLQHSIDNLLFYRNTMHYALQSPISTDISRQALADFSVQRTQPYWQLLLDLNRGMPINGVSDEFVSHGHVLDRDESWLYPELEAALEFSYIMQLADDKRDLQRRVFYASRAGFFLSSTPPENDPTIVSLYYRLIAQPYFGAQSPENNPGRGLQWTHTYNPSSLNGQIITASVPLDLNQRWYGVLAMDFPVSGMHEFLQGLSHDRYEGTVMLFDRQFSLIATAANSLPLSPVFNAKQQAEIARSMESGEEGELRMDSRFVTWAKLMNFDGVLIKVHTLSEGVQGEFGRISIVLTVLWLLFTLMLFISWRIIRRLVSNMLTLQQTLSWRANYDTLTRLYNRGAFFDIAHGLAQDCQREDKPFSVIQMDLDFFKGINDRFGHHAGDKVLSHAAALLASSLREGDVAGRVGGEEFCVLLPGTRLPEAAAIAERIRLRINTKELFLQAGQTLKISASFGVSCAHERHDYDFEHLQSIADRRLYKAKQHGRNQVCMQD
ncbi:cellulose biosynthesis regulator diguanylate cyclase DgcQ [Cedecea neteri]|uniref:cellulose biosynthesis regulator diguanylate cyclase DgcQ n=1 Tax=Cedecea neteri TaxID=158822 RepID=UPI002AA65BF9|nr:cellulose biosynthesis regulator diguanylate cyclase DgcQ [Cedecea neteri]WPU24832.1 cellulose biosynthesis regulator diguanylate cyclase DgcQ [Cedecea neteri]